MTTFTWTVDYGATAERQPRIRSAQFGDGYEQRSPDGLNTQPNVWQVTFANRDSSEIDDIEEFLTARQGVIYFEWTPPRSATEGRYICKQWSRQAVAGTFDTLSATFQEVFDNA